MGNSEIEKIKNSIFNILMAYDVKKPGKAYLI